MKLEEEDLLWWASGNYLPLKHFFFFFFEGGGGWFGFLGGVHHYTSMNEKNNYWVKATASHCRLIALFQTVKIIGQKSKAQIWLNYPPIAGERVHIHYWTIIVRTTQSCDLAGYKVTINSLIALGATNISMLLSLLFSFLCQLELLWRKQMVLFSLQMAVFQRLLFSLSFYIVFLCLITGEKSFNIASMLWDGGVDRLLSQCLRNSLPSAEFIKDQFIECPKFTFETDF